MSSLTSHPCLTSCCLHTGCVSGLDGFSTIGGSSMPGDVFSVSVLVGFGGLSYNITPTSRYNNRISNTVGILVLIKGSRVAY